MQWFNRNAVTLRYAVVQLTPDRGRMELRSLRQTVAWDLANSFIANTRGPAL
jgi:hypothetical protein